MSEHPYNTKVVEVRRLCEEIADMEEALEAKHAALKEATKNMMVRKRRIRNGNTKL